MFTGLTFTPAKCISCAHLDLLTASAVQKATAVRDPCTENMLMDNLHRRHRNVTTVLDEPNLCDYLLDEGR